MWLLHTFRLGFHCPIGQAFCLSQWMWFLSTVSFAGVIPTSWRCSSPFLLFVQILLLYHSLFPWFSLLLSRKKGGGVKAFKQRCRKLSKVFSSELPNRSLLWQGPVSPCLPEVFQVTLSTGAPMLAAMLRQSLILATGAVWHLGHCDCPSDILWSPTWSSALLPYSVPCSRSYLMTLNNPGWLWHLWMT